VWCSLSAGPRRPCPGPPRPDTPAPAGLPAPEQAPERGRLPTAELAAANRAVVDLSVDSSDDDSGNSAGGGGGGGGGEAAAAAAAAVPRRWQDDNQVCRLCSHHPSLSTKHSIGIASGCCRHW
jgi:hypothetical protein